MCEQQKILQETVLYDWVLRCAGCIAPNELELLFMMQKTHTRTQRNAKIPVGNAIIVLPF